MLNAPQNLIIPALYAGDTAIIRWDSVSGADGYVLERRFDETFDGLVFTWDDYELRFPSWNVFEARQLTWNQQDALEPSFAIYTGTEPSYGDQIPFDAYTAIYRVQAFRGGEYSVFTTSELIPISVEPRPPVISGQDGDIGGRFQPFNLAFEAHDPDDRSRVDVTATLNGVIIGTWIDIPQRVENFVEITQELFGALQIGSVNTIVITAEDDTGLTATRTNTFTVVEDTITDAVFFVMRDGVPVGRLTTERRWLDFTAVGTHQYFIRGVDKYDNFVDSNVVTLTISVDFATLALAQSPESYIEMIYGLGAQPTRDRTYNVTATGTLFEGRVYSVFNVGVSREDSMNLSFLVRNKSEYDTLFALVANGKPLIYRDRYDLSMFGLVLSKSDSFQGVLHDLANNYLVNYTITINRIDFNEAISYD